MSKILSAFIFLWHTLRDYLVSPGRIPRNKLADGVDFLKDACDELAGCDKDDLEVIAHAIGSYRRYPMGIRSAGVYANGKGGDQEVRDICELIDLTFESDEITSVELDIQSPPPEHFLRQDANQDDLFILHNWQKKWKRVPSPDHPAVDYFYKNTLAIVLDHFIEKEYHKTRRIHIEIKTTYGCHAPNEAMDTCHEVSVRLAEVIKDYLLKVQPTVEAGRNWISVFSFSAGALQAFRNALPSDLQEKVDYGFIAGIQRLGIRWLLGQAKGAVPHFNEELRNFAATTSWLNSIYFSMQGITDFTEVFNEIAAQRKAHDEQAEPLKFIVSNYPWKPEKFCKEITSSPPFELPLTGILVDIDD